jgi:hypothetical protein
MYGMIRLAILWESDLKIKAETLTTEFEPAASERLSNSRDSGSIHDVPKAVRASPPDTPPTLMLRIRSKNRHGITENAATANKAWSAFRPTGDDSRLPTSKNSEETSEDAVRAPKTVICVAAYKKLNTRTIGYIANREYSSESVDAAPHRKAEAADGTARDPTNKKAERLVVIRALPE